MRFLWRKGVSAGLSAVLIAGLVPAAVCGDPVLAGQEEAGRDLPAYTASGYETSSLNSGEVFLSIPEGWGNNTDADMAERKYSPVNQSGAISPEAATLCVNWYETEDDAPLDTFVDNLKKNNFLSGVSSETTVTAGLDSRRNTYQLTASSNTFDCESVCFLYNDYVYTVEMLQGGRSAYNYFPVYDTVIESLSVGSQAPGTGVVPVEPDPATPVPDFPADEPDSPTPVPDFPAGEPDTATPVPDFPAGEPDSPTPVPDFPAGEPDSPTPVPDSSTPSPDAAAELLPGDLGSFTYLINGHLYSFPTTAALIKEGDLPIDSSLTLPGSTELSIPSGGQGTGELANSQLFTYHDHVHSELIGISNLTMSEMPIIAGTITSLVDTEGSYVNLTLPGGITIGAQESRISEAFPEFASMKMDGIAGFRGNELLYACNVRPDGTNGYALIRNDSPFYSCLTIICENGAIREINFGCLGKQQAEESGIFE